MTEKNQVWKCNVCGNIVEILHEGADALKCCGEPMVLMKENFANTALKDRLVDSKLQKIGEKHIPIIDVNKVSVGKVLHPMDKDHYIEWIELTLDTGRIIKKFLKPGDSPILEFCCGVVSARCYCNLHGLWESS